MWRMHVEDADWKTGRNYSLLAIGFSLSGYLMYRNRSSVYSSIESMVYTKEERINRRMKEWGKSIKGTEDHERFCMALTNEILEGSNDVSKDCFSKKLTCMDEYRKLFGYGTEITKLYSSIESLVYIKEDRIHRRMYEWNRSAKGVEDHKKFCQALIAEISTGSDLSGKFMIRLIGFLEENKELFGPHITIFDFCKCVENRKDYSADGWYLLTLLRSMVDINFSAPGISDPLLIPARDILHNFLKDLPAEATYNVLLHVAEMYRFICLYVYNDASYRVSFPEHVWDRIMAALDVVEFPEFNLFYHILRDNFTE